MFGLGLRRSTEGRIWISEKGTREDPRTRQSDRKELSVMGVVEMQGSVNGHWLDVGSLWWDGVGGSVSEIGRKEITQPLLVRTCSREGWCSLRPAGIQMSGKCARAFWKWSLRGIFGLCWERVANYLLFSLLHCQFFLSIASYSVYILMNI